MEQFLLTVGNREYRVCLPTQQAAELEKQLNMSLMDAIGESAKIRVQQVFLWAGLQKYQHGITQADVLGIMDDMADGFTITNTKETPPAPVTISVTGTKSWVGDTASDRPASITLQLKKGSTVMGSQTVSAPDWSYTWTGLAKEENGTDIVYTVDEESVPTGYSKGTPSSSTDSSGNITVTITNTLNGIPPETIDVHVKKSWEGDTESDRPGKVTVYLLVNGERDTSYGVLELNASGNWEGMFPGLPKTDANGDEIKYDVEEDPVPDDYTMTSKTGSASGGFTITNTKDETPPPEPGTIDVSVTKVWSDQNDKAGKRPKSVTINLLADGKSTGKTLTLSEANGWKGTFSELPDSENGKTIVYTITENAVSGYTTSISGSAKAGFTVTNKFVPSAPPEIPKTGDSGHTALYAGLAFIAGAAAAWILMHLRKRKED